MWGESAPDVGAACTSLIRRLYTIWTPGVCRFVISLGSIHPDLNFTEVKSVSSCHHAKRSQNTLLVIGLHTSPVRGSQSLPYLLVQCMLPSGNRGRVEQEIDLCDLVYDSTAYDTNGIIPRVSM